MDPQTAQSITAFLSALYPILLALIGVGGFYLNWRKQTREGMAESRSDLAADYARVKSERDDLLKQIEILKLAIEGLNSKILQLNSIIDGLRKRIDELNAIIDEILVRVGGKDPRT